MGANLHDLGFVSTFFDMPEAQGTKENIDKLVMIKIKACFYQRM
jgi:hypothetical protein